MKESDLLYFGHKKDLQEKCKTEILNRFPNAIIEDACEEFKGYRITVEVETESEDEFKLFLLTNGWGETSFYLGMLRSTDNNRDRYVNLLKRAVDMIKEEEKKGEQNV